MRRTRRGKALDISQAVRAAVLERDGCCILCGSYHGLPNAHFVPRSQGGLGIEENIVTLCPTCHYRYDQTTDRAAIMPIIERYLTNKYQEWDKSKLYYRKG